MPLAPNWEWATAATAALAVTVGAVRGVTPGGAVAGFAVGAAVSAGFGPPGLWMLGTFFVVGTAATRLGYTRKAARGTAERRGGVRGATNVLGKGGIAALLGAAAATDALGPAVACIALGGALAAALGDTLGTEIGSLSRGTPRTLPTFRAVPHGTPGAVSAAGLLATALGAVPMWIAALATGALDASGSATRTAPALVAAAFGGPLAESVLVGVAPAVLRVPGWVRNFVPTAAGAGIAVVIERSLRP